MAHKTYIFTRLAFLLGCVCMIAACENSQEDFDRVYKKQIAVEEAKEIVSYLSEGGKVKAKLTSPFMLRYQTDSPYIEFPRTLHVDFYNDSTDVIESTVDARYAKYIEFDRKVLLRDSVVVLSFKNGDTLTTQELWWDQNKKEFFTDKPAHVHQRDKIIPALKGLRAAENLTWYDFYSVKKGQIDVPKNTVPE